MKASDVGFGAFFFRITTCHMVTYMIVGIAAYTIMDYATAFSQEGSIMVPADSRWVASGPALQAIRGLIFALALYPFRRIFLDEERGWLKLWGLLAGLGILSTFGPAPGSVEGMIYTRTPILDEERGWLKLWGLLAGLGILSTFGPAPGSVEGMIYTRTPILEQVVGLWEVALQSLALSVLVVRWHLAPNRAWNLVMGALAALVVLFSLAGALLPRPEYLR